MSNLLQAIGFDKRIGEDFIAFRHVPQEAAIVLPVYDPSAVVGPAHRLGIEKTIVGRGVLTEEEWEHRLAVAMRPIRRLRHAAVEPVTLIRYFPRRPLSAFCGRGGGAGRRDIRSTAPAR